MKTVVVVAGILQKNNQILLAKRKADSFMSGFWELPGGKVEAGETLEQALVRELAEELGITCTSLRRYRVINHCYVDKKVQLYVYRINDYEQFPYGKEGQAIRWVDITALSSYQDDLLPTMQTLVNSLTLANTMWITPNDVTLADIEYRLLNGIKLLQLRFYEKASHHFVKTVYERCKAHNAKLILNVENGLDLLDVCDGVHLSSQALRVAKVRPVAADKLLSVATHNSDELTLASSLAADFVLLSPVLKTPSHPEAEQLGWRQTQQLINEAKLPVMLLGGLSCEHLPQALTIGAIGIAGIRLLAEHQQ